MIVTSLLRELKLNSAPFKFLYKHAMDASVSSKATGVQIKTVLCTFVTLIQCVMEKV